MSLAVVEANGLDAREGVERMSEADSRILAAREQHQGAGVTFHRQSHHANAKSLLHEDVKKDSPFS